MNSSGNVAIREGDERLESLTFLFTDIEGSTVRWERFPVDMRLALARHDALLREAIVGNGGVVFKTIGDAFCAVFTDADNALAAAVAIHLALAREDFTAVDGIAVRIALHAGVAERRDDDYFGPNVNRVARLLAIGHGGQVLLSEAARERLSESALLDIALEDLGTHRLKDLSKPERVTLARPPGMTRRFPPLRSLGALAHNLPVQVTSFVGREREVEEITELVRQHRLVTLTGAGGTGKTRASLYAAANFSDGSMGNIWFVELAGLSDGTLIPLAIASTIGILLRADDEQPAALVRELRDKSMLLVLDNCEHLIESVASVVASILRTSLGIRILTSSRQPLSIAGEHAYRIPSLAIPEAGHALTAEEARRFAAIALFVDRASAADRRFSLNDGNAGAIADICRRLDGIALAIELAAARVRVLSPVQIRARLDERLRVLVGGDRSALPRQQTLRALIDWSYDLLDSEERRALRELAILAGSFPLDAAEAVCSIGTQLVTLDLLFGLVDKSLVTAEENDSGEMRYRLLESIREYAFEKAKVAGEAATLSRRLAGWALDRMQGAHDDWKRLPTREWERTYVGDLDNLRAAFVWSLEWRGDIDLGRRLAVASRRFWGRVASSEGARWIDLAASLTDAATAVETQAEIALAQAQVLVALRRHPAALAAAMRAIEGLSGTQSGTSCAEARMFAGYTLSLVGRSAEARTYLREALEEFVARGERQLTAYSTHDLALVCLKDGDVALASELLRDAVTRFTSLENQRGVVAATANLAELEFIQGNPHEAIELVDRAIALGSDASDASLYFVNRSAYCIAIGRWDEALASAGSALGIARRNGVGVDIAFALQRYAAVASFREHDHERAAVLIGYVDARIGTLGGIRQHGELEEYGRIVRASEGALGNEAFRQFVDIGSKLSEDEALVYVAGLQAREG